jgi:amidophosphoribosyltransferase
MCAIAGVWNHPNAFYQLREALVEMVNRGDQASCVATYYNELKTLRKIGPASSALRDGKKGIDEAKQSYMGIAHGRYPTAGSDSSREEILKNSQPVGTSEPCTISIAGNGDVIEKEYNRAREFLEDVGRKFTGNCDTEVILHYFAHNLSLDMEEEEHYSVSNEQIIRNLRKTIDYFPNSAFSDVGMIIDRGKRRMFGFTDRNRIRPFVYGHKQIGKRESWMMTSETIPLYKQEYHNIKNLYPGEILLFDDNGMHLSKSEKQLEPHPCMFEYAYFSRPANEIFKKRVQEVRMSLGRVLAEQDLENDFFNRDVIFSLISIPDGGNAYRDGYANRILKSDITNFKIVPAIDKRNTRAFMQPLNEVQQATNSKHTVMKNLVDGEYGIIFDDSLVRGTTSKKIVEDMNRLHMKEIHLRFGTPKIRKPCDLGVNMKDPKQFLVRTDETGYSVETDEEIAKEIGSTTAAFTTIDAIEKSIGMKPCTGCLGRWYPGRRKVA